MHASTSVLESRKSHFCIKHRHTMRCCRWESYAKVAFTAVVSSQVGSASLLPLFKVESLEITSELLKWQLHQEHTEEDGRWLNVLQFFSAVKNLYPSENTLPSLAYALNDVPEERITEVLPTLQGLTMDEPLPPLIRSRLRLSKKRLSGSSPCDVSPLPV